MAFRVRIDWAPVYELNVSLQAFLLRKVHKALDLGPGWATRVRKNLPAAFLADLQRLEEDKSSKDKTFLSPEILILQCPGDRDPEGFLAWLASLSPGDIYERLAPHVPEDVPLPRDLANARDTTVRLLRTWYDSYFRGLDSAILKGLAREAAAREAARAVEAPGAGPEASAFVETVTGGVIFEDLPSGLEQVVLVPQFHLQPLNLIGQSPSLLIVGYPADVVPPAENEPPADVLRRTKALADGSRLRILRFLAASTAEPWRSLTDIAEATGLAASTVLHHLFLLRSAGLVRTHFAPKRPDRYSHRQAGLTEMLTRLESYVGRKES